MVNTLGRMPVEAMIDLFLGLQRMSPGSQETTAQAFQIAARDREIQSIVEFGCGNGISTIDLARLGGVPVTAIDNCAPFLSQLKDKIDKLGLGQQVQVLDQSMDAAWPEETRFDLIWCEGSVYAIGLEDALKRWRKLLPQGGRIAVSDLVWIASEPALEAKRYWENQGLGLRNCDEARALFTSLGYRMIDDFVFPNRDWQNYYQPLKSYLPKWQSAYSDRENARIVSQMLEEEIRMYDEFGSQYGYVFFIAERVG